MVSAMSGLVVILFSVWNLRCGIILFFFFFFFDVPWQVESIISGCLCRTCLGHNCSVEEKLEIKRGEEVLEEVEKFCYLGDMIGCYGGASKAVSSKIGSAWRG